MALTSPFTKTSCIDFPLLPLRHSLSELAEMLNPRAAVLVLPQIKLNSQLSSCTFFYSTVANRQTGLNEHHLHEVSGQALGGRGPILPRVTLCIQVRAWACAMAAYACMSVGTRIHTRECTCQ